MIQRSVRAKNVHDGYYKMWAVFFGLGGLTALAISFFSWENIKSVILIPMGLISLFLAFYYLLMFKKISGKK